MPRIEYSAKFDPATTAKAMALELNVSPRHCYEILREIRGKKLSVVKTFLEDVISMKKSVPFKRFNRNVGHKRHQTGWDAGRYPVKACGEILTILKNAEANAEYKGLDTENMRVIHAASKRGRVTRGMMPRAMGRATDWNKESVTVEIVLGEEVR